MNCIAANILAGITVLIILFDIVQQEWSNLPYHAGGGIVLTLLFWLLCRFMGSDISFSILVVPLLFLFIFVLGILFTQQSLKNQGCCLTCATNDSTNESKLSSITSKPTDQCELDKRKLKAMPIL